MRSCAISHTLIYNVSDVDSRVLSTQLANQGFLLLQRVSHGDCSENLRGSVHCTQACQLPALIELVTGHEQREAVLLGSPIWSLLSHA